MNSVFHSPVGQGGQRRSVGASSSADPDPRHRGLKFRDNWMIALQQHLTEPSQFFDVHCDSRGALGLLLADLSWFFLRLPIIDSCVRKFTSPSLA